jgi:selenobiotic family peptide radical SAM maturase
MVPVNWRSLIAFIASEAVTPEPLTQTGHVMIWQHPESGKIKFREAADVDLLALKLIVEQVDPREAAALGDVTPGDVWKAINRAVKHGFLLSPPSRIQRVQPPAANLDPALQQFVHADLFTLQWHITQACDLHCKHCYDRSERDSMRLDRALTVLDDFYDFCQRMHVQGQVTFTGGNPLLYPHFDDLYRTAFQLGFGIAILGNPTPRNRIEEIADIATPLYFQISLEGLAPHNDDIRGKGHFSKSLAFLDMLQQLGIFSMVMLTLTRDNLDQVLPLAELLKHRADFFTFNRLSTVGEGANLLMPQKKAFKAFLKRYEKAVGGNPILGRKDNLLNIVRWENGHPPFGGCTGYGCGAAFNFMALLPDGEVHACRKFPSAIGNIRAKSLYDIYHTAQANRYRAGSQACKACGLNLVCRGCLAITHSMGLDVFDDKDPFCFAIPDS